ncbi:MAG TPA: zf-HC2 domain-containing protein [Gemmatimonadales bacterium]|nr:zf-HC2 domain-containing protein [Gemmatimonadales bacterium]
MWHPEDGVLHALLDGELTGDARLKVEAHLRNCAECDTRFREAKAFAVEADSLVNAIDVPPARTSGRTRLPGRRRIRFATLAWAATLVLAAGLGYWGQDTIRRAPPAELREGDRPATHPAARAESIATTSPKSKAAPNTDETTTDRVAGGRDQQASKEEALPPAGPELPSAEEGKQAENRARVAEPPAEAQPTAPALGGVAAAVERAREDAAAPLGWRTVTMEQAVQVLGGAVRLVDGLTPERFDVGPGTLVPGGDPTREVVRVVYAGGGIVLDQQRSDDSAALRRAARYEDAAARTLSAQPARRDLEWRLKDGFRYVVTGTVGADSLEALTDRVR